MAKAKKIKLALHDQRMLEVIHFYKTEKDVNARDFLISIGFDHRNLHQVTSGRQSFKIHHFANCIEVYKINPVFFFKKRAKMYSQK